jgi:hypothetical protein
MDPNASIKDILEKIESGDHSDKIYGNERL